jgi:hypothetical protein
MDLLVERIWSECEDEGADMSKSLITRDIFVRAYGLLKDYIPADHKIYGTDLSIVFSLKDASFFLYHSIDDDSAGVDADALYSVVVYSGGGPFTSVNRDFEVLEDAVTYLKSKI